MRTDLDELRHLWVYGNYDLGGNLPREIYTLKYLRELLMGNCSFTGTISPEIANLSRLEDLMFYNNLLTGELPAEIGALTDLSLLIGGNYDISLNDPSRVLNSNIFSGELPSELGNLQCLNTLFLYNAGLSGPVSESFGDMTALQSIYLGRNKLSGGIPPELGKLQNLMHLDLSNNLLTGEIPDELCNLKNLITLHLDNQEKWSEAGRNQFTGSIPARIGDLTKLEACWLAGFGKLMDEYGYPGVIPSNEAAENIAWYNELGWGWNVDVTNDPSRIRWLSFLTDARYAGQVGIYEGALTYAYGAYRPSVNSIMRYNTGGFNAPSRHAIYKRVMDLSGEGYFYQKFIDYDAVNRTRAAAATRAQQTDRVDTRTFVPLHPPVIIKGSSPTK